MNILEARRRTLGKGVYKKTVEGNPAIAQGSLARMYPGITMQGWTEQAQYEGKNLFDASLAEDNKYQNASLVNNEFSIVSNNNYWITGKIPIKPNTTYSITPNVNGAYYSDYDTVIKNVVKAGTPFTTPENANYVCLSVPKESYPFGYNIMLNEGSTALPYEPYTGGKPSPSPEYPQEIVSAGKYNEDTQKWEYEITIANEQTDPDKNQTVLLTSDRPLTKWDKLEKRNGQWGWVYKSKRLIIDESVTINNANGESAETIPYQISSAIGVKNSNDICCISNILRGIDNNKWNSASAVGTYLMNNGVLTFRLKSEWASNISEAKQFMIDHDAHFVYESSQSTFVPLSESEQE